MTLNVVNPFLHPLHLWTYRQTTQQEQVSLFQKHGYIIQNVPDRLVGTISDMYQAANYIALNHVSVEVSNHITEALKTDFNFKIWRNSMPGKTPQNLINYQNSYPPTDINLASHEVSQHGVILPDDQIVFHGGIWPINNCGFDESTIKTTRVLSTTLCPEIAISNSNHNGKAEAQGRVDLVVIKLKNVKTKAFVFNPFRGQKKHEKEVLFNSGATLKFLSRQFICNTYPVGRDMFNLKRIPVYIINAELS
ncbi:hypothetical protein GC087_19940 [Pantoea sp. JZ2]|uniref:hypothetical protein n=1 Tax=Pantoea sp. JZ2 TaxID=2654189 RepID=UPI002B48E0D6|nr:hypothetical protein [Pantoea sp. JZ2]WRH14713.1 hypothetical protein GC087_19940 [Pantoea sp. JZ2]